MAPWVWSELVRELAADQEERAAFWPRGPVRAWPPSFPHCYSQHWNGPETPLKRPTRLDGARVVRCRPQQWRLRRAAVLAAETRQGMGRLRSRLNQIFREGIPLGDEEHNGHGDG